eukprot:Skav225888  [mRNA]  locus=scaffold1460:86967:93115:- [translate_table: standard]
MCEGHTGHKLFSEVWSRLVGDTRALQGVLDCCSGFTIEALTAIGALFVLLVSMEPSCDAGKVWGTLLVVVSTGAGMAAISLLAGFSLRSSSRMSRSMMGYLYSYMSLGCFHDSTAACTHADAATATASPTTLQPSSGIAAGCSWHLRGNFFEIKFIPESFASTTAAYEEIQSASLEQRKHLSCWWWSEGCLPTSDAWGSTGPGFGPTLQAKNFKFDAAWYC